MRGCGVALHHREREGEVRGAERRRWMTSVVIRWEHHYGDEAIVTG